MLDMPLIGQATYCGCTCPLLDGYMYDSMDLGGLMTKWAKVAHVVGLAVALYVWYWVAVLLMAAY